MRKSGETHKQYIRRLEAQLASSQESNRALRILNAEQNKTNPRTGRTYESEARELFSAIALVEYFLRTSPESDMPKIIMQQILLKYNFNDVDIYQDECLLPGAYDGKK